MAKDPYNEDSIKVSVIESHLKSRKRLEELQDALLQLETMPESVEEELAMDDTGDTERDRGSGLRTIRVTLTQGMINQQLLTLTAAKRRGIIQEGEKFTIVIPGEKQPIETELVLARGERLKKTAYKRYCYLSSLSRNRIYYLHGEFIYVFRIEFNVYRFITVIPARRRVLAKPNINTKA
ncbi:MAG: hypothetical protein JJU20_14865 [Opitutales bacterium]|nr:hypothetical protein [Opitutales bacterium]